MFGHGNNHFRGAQGFGTGNRWFFGLGRSKMPNGRVCVLAVESCGGFSWACTRRPVTPVLWSLKWFFVALDSSHGVLSVIFGILGKFWIDTGVQKKIYRNNFRRKKAKRFSKIFGRKMFGRISGFSTFWGKIKIFEISKILKF